MTHAPQIPSALAISMKQPVFEGRRPALRRKYLGEACQELGLGSNRRKPDLGEGHRRPARLPVHDAQMCLEIGP
jgi:hypothetical protein